MERDVANYGENLDQTDFNSRAHVERDAVDRKYQKQGEISTHALTWSATDLKLTFVN